jgi:hypothetical protein
MKLEVAHRLTAMPALIESQDFGLSRPGYNKQHLVRLLADPTCKALKIKGIELNRVGDDSDFIIFAHAKDLITYYVSVSRVNLKPLEGRAVVMQTAVWRALGKAPDGVTGTVFTWLVQKYGTIVSDSHQTPDGKRFWIGRLTRALAQGCKVFLMKDLVLTPLDSDTLDQFIDPDSFAHAWGDESYARYRFVIEKV